MFQGKNKQANQISLGIFGLRQYAWYYLTLYTVCVCAQAHTFIFRKIPKTIYIKIIFLW